MPARRFLAPQARTGDGHGYLSQPQREFPQLRDEPEVVERIAECRAMCDEPETIGPAIVDAYAELGRTYDLLRRQAQITQARQDRQLLTAENRIRDVHRRAKMQHVDVSHEMQILRKMLDRGKETAAVTRIERLEARLDGVSEAA